MSMFGDLWYWLGIDRGLRGPEQGWRQARRGRSRRARRGPAATSRSTRARQTDERQRQAAELRAEKQRQRLAERRRQHETTLALRADRQFARQLARLKREGWSDAEARDLLERQHDYAENPGAAVFELALRALGVRLNPRSYDTAAIAASETFHGSPREAQKIGGRDVVVLGKLDELAYSPPRGSQRGGSTWVHEVGDRGWLRPRAKRKPLLVADARTGKAQIVGGDMTFDPGRGLVG